MESDDDYQSFSPQQQSSPVQPRRLKRLKKTTVPKKSPVKSINDLLSLPRVDFKELEALESSKIRGFEDSSEPPQSQSSSEGFDVEKELRSAGDDEELSSGFVDKETSSGIDDLRVHKERKENESLDFDEFDGKGSSDFGDLPFQNERKEAKRSLEFVDVIEKFDEKLNSGSDDMHTQNERKETKRSLEFDDVVEEYDGKGSSGFDDLPTQIERNETKISLEFDEEGDNHTAGEVDETLTLNTRKNKKKRANKDASNEKKEKTKKAKSSGDKMKPKASSSNKLREEKERRAHLQQLHAESQRVLRESRCAAFKPLPFVQKPISSVLEKIRQRKLEMTRKFLPSKSIDLIAENNNEFTEVVIEHSETVNTTEVSAEKIMNLVGEENCAEDVNPKFDASLMGGSTLSTEQLSDDNVRSQPALDEESTPAFRVPLDDTQDLFDDSQTTNSKDELPSDEDRNSQEEVLAPSVLAMQLKFDSAPPDDISSDEEENDKENVEPHPCKLDDGSSSPKGDPVKAFVDDEAAEDDDSDNDLLRFRDDEDGEDSEDLEDLKDMIATGYEEKPIDNEIRNELHQKWLEEKDASGTDDLLRRLKCGSELREAGLLDEEDDDEDEGFGSEADEDMVRTKAARINTKKAKQMIAQMFCDKEEAFSSSDDEETERKLVRQRLLNKVEEKSTLLSPIEDENSREVFGLIKKLNNVSEPRKKAKSSSFFDTMLTGGNSNSSSKSSFLSRASSHSLPASRKQGSSMVKSYIFGRDDSNSRSSITVLEDSSDTVSKDSQPATRKVTAKFSSSQTRTTTQTAKATTETPSGTSLFDLLKRSAMQQTNKSRNQDVAVGLSQSVFASFKIPKKPIKQFKMEGRT